MKQIKIARKFEVPGLNSELQELVKNLVHKDDIEINKNLTKTMVFYAADSSGGSNDIKNTIEIKNGLIKKWSQE